MNILIRKAVPADLPAAVAAEEAAMKGAGYLNDVSPMFFADTEGELMVAEADGAVVAVSKYTVMPDHTAWLETLRVAPAYQRMGIGRRFYERFQALSKERNITSMAMYTGVSNVPSASLARVFGLDTAGVYRESSLPLTQETDDTALAGDFRQVDPDRACELLSPLVGQWKGFVILNRTFFHMNDEVFRDMAKKGLVYEDCESKSVMILGNRFLEKRSLQIGILHGDLEKCLAFAKAEGTRRGVPQLTVMYPPEECGLQALLESKGYQTLKSDLQVMEGPAF